MVPCPYNKTLANVSKHLLVQYSKRNTKVQCFTAFGFKIMGKIQCPKLTSREEIHLDNTK